MSNFIKLATVAISIVALSSCSTLKHGQYDKVEIVSNVDAAHCRIYREGEGMLKAVSTPDARYIKRSDKPITVVCEKSGYQTTSVTVAPELVGEAETNLANLGVGMFIDTITSAEYHYPDTINVKLAR